jgi:hypothetical protein
MNQAETRAELIDPKLKASGRGVVEGLQNPAGILYHGRENPDRRQTG